VPRVGLCANRCVPARLPANYVLIAGLCTKGVALYSTGCLVYKMDVFVSDLSHQIHYV
jgi:hypothetical protein